MSELLNPPPALHEVDVVIVGGGISGLFTALRLKLAGFTNAVVERHDHVGGRLATEHTRHGHFDLGATWFWPGENRVAALIKELGVATHPHHLAGDAMYEAPTGAQRLDGNPIDVNSGRFSFGAASLTDRLAEQLGGGIITNSAVSNIHQSGNAIQVRHTGGLLGAHHVVLALPPAVAMHTIDFTPTWPDELAALAAATPTWMGNIVKVVAVYSQAFWHERGLSGSAVSHIGPLREIHDMSGVDHSPAALFGFAPMTAHQAAPTSAEIIIQLVNIFGPDAATPLDIIIKDWRVEAHHNDIALRQSTAMETYGHRLFQQPTSGGRIHWASTETAAENPGHIEGALAAAQRAVNSILSTV